MDPLLELIRTAAQVIGLLQKSDNNTDNKQKGSGNIYIENQYNYYPSESPKESTHQAHRPENSSSKPRHLFIRHPVIGIVLIGISLLIVLRSLSGECVSVLAAETNLSSSPHLRSPTPDFYSTELDSANRQRDERTAQRHYQWKMEFDEQYSDALQIHSRDINQYCTVDAAKHHGFWTIPIVFLAYWILGKWLTQKGW